MIQWIDRHYIKIVTLIVLFGIVAMFSAAEYVSWILLLYILINAIKSRAQLKRKWMTTSPKKKVLHAIGFIAAVSGLTISMLMFSSIVDRYSLPTYASYLFIAALLFIGGFVYSLIVERKGTG